MTEKPLKKSDRIIANVVALVILALSEWAALDTVKRLSDDPSWLLWMMFVFIIGPGVAYIVLAVLIKAGETIVEMLERKPKA